MLAYFLAYNEQLMIIKDILKVCFRTLREHKRVSHIEVNPQMQAYVLSRSLYHIYHICFYPSDQANGRGSFPTQYGYGKRMVMDPSANDLVIKISNGL